MFDFDLDYLIKISFFVHIIWLFVMSIIFFLTYFRILDIQTIVEGMKQCVT